MEYCSHVSQLVSQAAMWLCWISYWNKYVGLLILYMLPLLNPWQGNNNLSLIDIKEAIAKIKTFSITNCYNFLSFTQLYQEPLLMQEPLLNVSHQQQALQTKFISFWWVEHIKIALIRKLLLLLYDCIM